MSRAEKHQNYHNFAQETPEKFWAEIAQRIDWIKPFTEVKKTRFDSPVSIEWFADGSLNICANCVDRHLQDKADAIALIWVGDEPGTSIQVTYQQLYERVCQFANILKNYGVKKGDRVTLYLPMIIESAVAMLACARIGAVHSVVFGGFSPEALAGRIQDCQSDFIITADQGRRGGKIIPLKNNVDQALKTCPNVRHVLVIDSENTNINWVENRDISFIEASKNASFDCPYEEMNAEDPFFILYTSGSTGKPKGVLHTTGGYIVYASFTHEIVFDYRAGDIYWCTADIGWITGHSYMIYGPLTNGATTLLFEGVPHYPDAGRFWQIIDEFKVSIFYTAPTAIRALMREGDEFVTRSKRDSLRILGTVGEPINPEAWRWYFDVVGNQNCPVIDTWWQTETGGIMIAPIAGITDLKPGSATHPFFGIQPVLVDANGHILEGEAEGHLCILDSWPGQMRTVYGDHKRFEETYFSQFPGKYFTGDGCRRDEDGYYWITGRVDDVINVSGHRLGTAEIESALVAHDAVSESAVVGYAHDIKGQGIYAFVTLKNGFEPSTDLKKDLITQIRTEIGPIASPDYIQWAPALPKTRSGKIMRRILRKIANGETDSLGDTSTLADPEIVHQLLKNK